MHILHVLIQKFEMLLNHCCGLGHHTNVRSRRSFFLYLLWVLKRTVSLSTYNLPMLWLDPHFYEKGSFYAHAPPATKGGIHWRGGGTGIIFGTDPVGVGHGRNWPRVV